MRQHFYIRNKPSEMAENPLPQRFFCEMTFTPLERRFFSNGVNYNWQAVLPNKISNVAFLAPQLRVF
jgi:hypothetical protein